MICLFHYVFVREPSFVHCPTSPRGRLKTDACQQRRTTMIILCSILDCCLNDASPYHLVFPLRWKQTLEPVLVWWVKRMEQL